VLVGDVTGAVQLLDVATLRPLQTFIGHEHALDCVALLADGRRIFTADGFGNASVWDIASARRLSVRAGTGDARAGRVRGPDWTYSAVARDGSIAVTTNPDHVTLDAWSPASGQTIRTLTRTKYPITGVAISPNGKQLLCGDAGGRMYPIDLASGAFAEPLSTSQKPANLDCFAFATDGGSVLSAGHELVVRQWDLDKRREMRAFAGHTLIVRAVAFGRDDRTIFSSGADQTLRMWDVATGREFNLAARYKLPVYALAVIPPGDAAVVGAGPEIVVADVSRGVRHLDAAAGLANARARLSASGDGAGDDPAALATVGEWYAFRGDHEWAEQLLVRARGGGAKVSALTLARCYWQLGRPADAAREFTKARDDGEASRDYLNLCIAATTRESTGK
jgi:hypothetical protein